MRYPTAANPWGEEEVEACIKVAKSGNYTMGEITKEFEQKFADYINTKYCIACNSGSSANLLMVTALSLRYGPGTVIVPSIAWSTSYSPFFQNGWKLKFVDIDKKTLNYDIEKLKEAYQEGDLILAVNLLGNPNSFMEFPSMFLLEDNCESMGAEYAQMKTGNFGVMASHSTFFSHHISTMEGGLITTDDEYFYQMLLCIRSHGWTRHLPKDNLLGAHVGPFEFIYPGYNVRPLEMQSAIGIEQLNKLPKFVETRMANLKSFHEYCEKQGWEYQHDTQHGKSSSFGCALFSEDVEDIKKKFDEKEVEYRPIMSGNFTLSPSINYYDYEVCGDLDNTNWADQYGIFIGNPNHLMDWSILD